MKPIIMDWRKFCNFDANISISQSPLPVFWSKWQQRLTECGELTVCSPFLIAALISYAFLFVSTIRHLRGGPSLSNAPLSKCEIASLCLKFFSSFGACTCSMADTVFTVVYGLPTPTPAALITLSGQLASLLMASLAWLSIFCAYERISLNTFPSSFIGWVSILITTTLRFYDAFRVDNNWGPITISALVGLIIQFIYILSVIIFDWACKRRITGHVILEEDEVAFLHERSGSHDPAVIQLGPGDDRCGFVSKLTFYWTNALMKKGYKGQLTNPDELYSLPRSLNVHELEQKFKSESRNFETLRRFSFVRTMHSCFAWEFYSLGILKFFSDTLSFAGPILLGYLVDFMTQPDAYWWLGYAYAGAMLLASFLSATFSVHFNYLVNKVGLKVRSVVVTCVYDKFLKVPQVELGRFSSGEMMNFMSTDSERVVNFCRSFHDFWSLPMQIAVALFLLYREVGLAFLAGVAFALVLIPINRWIALKIANLSTGMMANKDSRVKLMAELLFGIRIVKFGAWEETFTNRIKSIRRSELKYLKGRKYLDALCVYMWACAPVVIAILTFATYILIGNRLTAAKVFTSIALFNILITPLNAFPWVVNGVVEAWVSCKRLQRFFDLEDFDFDSYYNRECEKDANSDICMHEATFTWSPSQIGHVLPTTQSPSMTVPQRSEESTLRNLSFTVTKGQLIGVIGSVGGGKSSLFAAVLGEIRKHEDGGSIHIKDLEHAGVAYVSQEPWLQHGSVRQNILFGQPYQADLYDAVVTGCALTSDFRQMPNGDLSELGEQGVTLSGGQRSRIALARAVYQNKGIYLLDDPLSAVDSHVAKFLFNRCIRGLLHGKTVILATHHIEYLRNADLIIVMKNGCIEAMGKPEDILAIQTTVTQNHNDKKPDDNGSQAHTEPGTSAPEGGEPVFVQEEEKEVGLVKARVYGNYLKAIGALLTLSIILSLFLMQSSKNISDWWLSFWVSHTEDKGKNDTVNSHWLSGHFLAFDAYRHPYQLYVAKSVTNQWHHNSNGSAYNEDVDFYLKIYGILIGSNTVFALFRSFLYAYGCICAAKSLHEHLFARVLKAPVRFFDITPVGRLVNRFSSDIYSIDDSLPFQANRLVACLFGIVGTTVTMCYGLPWFAICIIPMAVLYYCVQRYYRWTTCDLKRVTSTSLSPIYSHFNDTFNGLQTIRAFRVADRFLEHNRSLLTCNQRAQYSALACTQWLSVRLQLMGVLMVGAVALIAVLEHDFRSVDPGLVGLAISYALSITSLLSGLLQAFTETEKEMVAVERVSEYIERTPVEKWRGTCLPPPLWPREGKIEFKNVQLRYSPDLPLALNGFTLTVQAGEKIGIVGRTGSGKSSILQALFRTVEIEDGQILIDGFDIKGLDLANLRSGLAIIPQTPFLFSGTVRQNLDVDGRYNDWRLQWAIGACHLDAVVTKMGGLDAEIGERGAGLSLGEKQLFCLARALLANAQILCIDEATAHVDTETDDRIQNTLKTALPAATVLTIAHRIRTVLDYDRIIVMIEGRIIEEGAPRELLEKAGSHFGALANVVA